MLPLVLLTALPFIWFGMVAAISFLETPLKFRAPGITRALGVGIGRLVFKALNLVEAAVALALVAAWLGAPGRVPAVAAVAFAAATAALGIQMAVLRPLMRTPAPGTSARTAAHLAYAGAEVLKAVALPVAGTAVVLAVAA